MTALVWHIRDLRTGDNPALHAAYENYEKVIPVYIYDETIGGASKWWLHHSLQSLESTYHKLGAKLVLRKGTYTTELKKLIKETGAEALYWNMSSEPEVRDAFTFLQKNFESLDLALFNGNYLIDPEEIKTTSGNPYSVFTPFKNAFHKTYSHQSPQSAPRKLSSKKVSSLKLSSLKLLPTIHWDAHIAEIWECGEDAAQKKLTHFLKSGIESYKKDRDFPAILGTSTLSPYLHFGEISPRQIWEKTLRYKGQGADTFRTEILWREFGNYFIYHFPKSTTHNWKESFNSFPWKHSASKLKAWQEGRTGYPIVDAAMRQLWQTGWMHNRLRMIVASFLIKDLLIDWRKGAEWFWDTLLDADLASNTLGWQWVAGSGPDAAPFFRIFNPILQGEKFDPDGTFVKTFCPELKNLPTKWIHKPSKAPAEVLEKADILLGETYPEPIVDHDEARTLALAAYKSLR